MKGRKSPPSFFMSKIRILHEINMNCRLVAQNSTSGEKVNSCFVSKKYHHFTKQSVLHSFQNRALWGKQFIHHNWPQNCLK